MITKFVVIINLKHYYYEKITITAGIGIIRLYCM